jgi:hypothetical protein
MEGTVKRAGPKGILIEEELVLLDAYRQQKKDADQEISFDDMKDLIVILAEINGGITRLPTTLWSRLKRAEAAEKKKLTDNETSKDAASDQGKQKKAVSYDSLAAKKVLEELATIMAFMNKPPEYLKPLEGLLVENQELSELLKAADEDITALKEKAKATDKVEQLKKEIEELRGSLFLAKKILNLTCGLRMQAIALTGVIEKFKKQEGINVFAFLQELDECGGKDEEGKS